MANAPTAPATLTGLFISHVGERCGVYQFGRRLFEALRQGGDRSEQVVNWIYAECVDLAAYNTVAGALRPNITLFNYHPLTLAWAKSGGWGDLGGTTFSIFHEVYQAAADELIPAPFDYMLCPDPTLVSRNPTAIRVPRFIPPVRAAVYPPPSRFTVGSFGFPTPNKGFARLCRLVNDQFDSAQVNINLPPHDWPGLISAAAAIEVEAECRATILKPDVRLTVTNRFFSNEELLTFLSLNTINAFLYHDVRYRGISSCTDYALSCGRPIAVSSSTMFRHLHGANPSICIEDRGLLSIAEAGVSPLIHHINEYSESNAGVTWNNAMVSAHVLGTVSASVPGNRGFARILDVKHLSVPEDLDEATKVPVGLKSQGAPAAHAFLIDAVVRLASLVQSPRILVVGYGQNDLRDSLCERGYRTRCVGLQDSDQPGSNFYYELERLRSGIDLVVCSDILATPDDDIFLVQAIEDVLAPGGFALFIAEVFRTYKGEYVAPSEGRPKTPYLDWNFPGCLINDIFTCKQLETGFPQYDFDASEVPSSLVSLVIRKFSAQEMRRALSPENAVYENVASGRQNRFSAMQSSLGRHGRLYDRMSSHFGESEHEGEDLVYQSNGINEGFLLFGPYVPLSAGRYCATIMVRLDEPIYLGEQEFAIVDIVTDGVPLKYAYSIEDSDLELGLFKPVSLDFALDENANHWEIRLRLAAPVRITVLAAAACRHTFGRSRPNAFSGR